MIPPSVVSDREQAIRSLTPEEVDAELWRMSKCNNVVRPNLGFSSVARRTIRRFVWVLVVFGVSLCVFTLLDYFLR